MRQNNRLGLWLLRVAVAVGAGSVALGVSSPSYANQVLPQASGLSAVVGVITAVDVTQSDKGSADSMNVTEDYEWA